MSLRVRPAAPEDSRDILRLIRLLAAFERSPASVTITEEVIRAEAFGPNRRFEVLLAEIDGAIRGAVVLLSSYSSWRGAPTLVVHDLFVEEPARGGGAGRALLAAAAALARRRGCCRMDVNVLDWNQAARRFYQAHGFTPLADWLPYRLDADGIAALAGDG